MSLRAFWKRRDGAAAVEFALTIPVPIALIFGGCMIGLTLWQLNLLKQVAAESARCVAIAAPACTTSAPSCGATAAKCYALKLATDRGLNGLSASSVTVNQAATVGGVSSTAVYVSNSYTLFGFSFSLSQSGYFPNV